MERNASDTKHLTLAPPSTSYQSVARTCGDFTLRCLLAIAQAYARSSAYNPYWIGACPLPTPSGREAFRQ